MTQRAVPWWHIHWHRFRGGMHSLFCLPVLTCRCGSKRYVQSMW